jgi:RND family efflux transporter MFP subunit
MLLPPPAARLARRLPPLLALALCLTLGCAKPPEEEQPPPAVVVWKVASVNFLQEWTEFAGTVVPLPDRLARITAPVEGKVASVLTGDNGKPVAEGQRVEPGTVLVKLDTTVAEANLAKLVDTQRALQAEEEQAQIDAELAQRELTRLQDLKKMETGGVTLVQKVELDRAASALKSAEAKFKAAGLRTVAGAKEVEAARKQLALYTLTAPIAGQLGRIQVAVGQCCTIGTPVADIVNVDEQIDVICFVPPRLIGRLKLGQRAHTGGADKNPQEEARGEVIFIADQAEPDTGNFAVKVRFANADKRLRANSVVRFSLLLQDGKECVSLPETAVQQDTDPPTVVVVTDIKVEENKEVVKQIDNLQKQQKEATERGDEKKAAELGREIEKLEKNRVTTKGVARRVKAEPGLKSRHQHQIEIGGLTDTDEEEGDKLRLLFELENGQWYALEFELKDGQRHLKRRDVAQFVIEGADGVQSGDIVKFKVDED